MSYAGPNSKELLVGEIKSLIKQTRVDSSYIPLLDLANAIIESLGPEEASLLAKDIKEHAK